MQGLEILDYNGAGYNATFKFNSWIVAYLNYEPRFDRETLDKLERHNKTDEVFILLEGEATLLVGEKGEEVKMEKFKQHVVKKGVWHNIIVSKDAKVIVVENSDTSKENSDYMVFSAKK